MCMPLGFWPWAGSSRSGFCASAGSGALTAASKTMLKAKRKARFAIFDLHCAEHSWRRINCRLRCGSFDYRAHCIPTALVIQNGELAPATNADEKTTKCPRQFPSRAAWGRPPPVYWIGFPITPTMPSSEQTSGLTDKLAVITGGSRGLGRAMAVALSAAGARVALVARDEAKLREAQQEIEAGGGRASFFVADVTREDDVQRLESQISAESGRANILINNAGINIRKNLIDFTLE